MNKRFWVGFTVLALLIMNIGFSGCGGADISGNVEDESYKYVSRGGNSEGGADKRCDLESRINALVEDLCEEADSTDETAEKALNGSDPSMYQSEIIIKMFCSQREYILSLPELIYITGANCALWRQAALCSPPSPSGAEPSRSGMSGNKMTYSNVGWGDLNGAHVNQTELEFCDSIHSVIRDYSENCE